MLLIRNARLFTMEGDGYIEGGDAVSYTHLSCIRELLGSGTIFGTRFMPEWFEPMAIAVQPAGGFILLGLTLAAVTGIAARSQKRKEAAK